MKKESKLYLCNRNQRYKKTKLIQTFLCWMILTLAAGEAISILPKRILYSHIKI